MPAPARVRVRMYRVGFGDCFLVTFPGPRHVVIDCGSLAGDQAMPEVVDDILAETERRIAVIIASHRHGEHVSGFAALASRWNEVRVDEVWMPWTEDPDDTDAVRLRRRQDQIAETLVALAPTEAARIAANSRTDPRAMDVLLDGFLGKPARRFLHGDGNELGASVLAGVHAHVIGPARSDEVLAAMEIGCSLASLSVEAMTRDEGPFARKWRLGEAAARGIWGRELHAREMPDAADSDTTEQLCFWLDKAVNNSSLFLLLRCGRARLLFPGDAQGQAWLPFLERPELAWELQRVNLYKVSHHGSHNGTPSRVVTAMNGPVNLVSTQRDPWPSLPHTPLLRELAGRGPVIRSDRPGRPRGFRKRRLWVEVELVA